jgi:endonuclease/exonuclease/phosphatase family metal-dependent hydrolase
MKILQANLNRSRAAHDMLLMEAARQQADFLLVSEPNEVVAANWKLDSLRNCGICQRTSRHAQYVFTQGRGYVSVELQSLTLISAYLSPNITLALFQETLEDIMGMVERARTPTILAGDFNAKSPMWGSAYEDVRGRLLADATSAAGLTALNDGTPTFERGPSTSVLDVTFVSDRLVRNIRGWTVLDTESLSDHSIILFEVGEEAPPRQSCMKRASVNQATLRVAIQRRMDAALNPDAHQITSILAEATEEATLTHMGRKQVYWWNPEVAILHRLCHQKRRELQRCRRRARRDDLALETKAEEYQQARSQLRKIIRKSKRDNWKELCAEADQNVWGTAYKIASKRWGRKLPIVPIPAVREVLETLFPRHERLERREIEATDMRLFTMVELQEAMKRIGLRKSGGPDGTPPEAIVLAIQHDPQKILAALNELIKNEDFPTEWKKARLVLLLKEGKPEGLPSSYRPLSLLNVVGKLYEQLITARLRDELEAGHHLSERQFGFRKGKSTLDAVRMVVDLVDEAAEGSRRNRKIPAVVTLDVRNAFNCASWKYILRRLHEMRISNYLIRTIQVYFENRSLMVEAEGVVLEKELTSGVPQGSVLGPTLWNVFYDEVLGLPLPEDCTTVAYADDLALVAVAKTEAELMHKVNVALEEVRSWLQEHGLQLAEEKTEAIIMAGRRQLAPISFRVGASRIRPTNKIKYLGVWLDHRRSFVPHVVEAASKADRTATSLTIMMSNVGGPRQGRRQMLAAVVGSVMLYAAPIWAKAMRINRARDRLQRVQRRMALRVCCAYRTVGAQKAGVLARLPPIELVVEDRLRRYMGMDKEDSWLELVAEWDGKWRQQDGWTQRLIPDLRQWINRSHGMVTYWTTQFFTGHGIFVKYLHKIGKSATPVCWYCPEEDTPEHTVFSCVRWEEGRRRCWTAVGAQTPDTIVNKMCASEAEWNIVEEFISSTMKQKQADEQQRRG